MPLRSDLPHISSPLAGEETGRGAGNAFSPPIPTFPHRGGRVQILAETGGISDARMARARLAGPPGVLSSISSRRSGEP
jgi:hypothetical protein